MSKLSSSSELFISSQCVSIDDTPLPPRDPSGSEVALSPIENETRCKELHSIYHFIIKCNTILDAVQQHQPPPQAPMKTLVAIKYSQISVHLASALSNARAGVFK